MARPGRIRALGPIAVLAVEAQLAFTGNGMSTTVAGSVPPPAAIALASESGRFDAVVFDFSGVMVSSAFDALGRRGVPKGLAVALTTLLLAVGMAKEEEKEKKEGEGADAEKAKEADSKEKKEEATAAEKEKAEQEKAEPALNIPAQRGGRGEMGQAGDRGGI